MFAKLFMLQFNWMSYCCPLMPQAQVEEFEKKLTAVHTKGLENVENEEREQQLEKQKNTPVPKSARRATRGKMTLLFLKIISLTHCVPGLFIDTSIAVFHTSWYHLNAWLTFYTRQGLSFLLNMYILICFSNAHPGQIINVTHSACRHNILQVVGNPRWMTVTWWPLKSPVLAPKQSSSPLAVTKRRRRRKVRWQCKAPIFNNL